jgi:thiol-disulfide isomerase/thioredoxin/outer membrane protein assembly factor BamB
LLCCGVLALGVLQPHPARAQAPAPTAESVLRRTADFFKGAKSFSVTIERVQKINDATVPTTIAVAFARPNRFALRTTLAGAGANPGLTVVCDGTKLFTSVAALKKYTETDAPGSFETIGTDPIVAATTQSLLIGELLADDPYAKLMEGVKTARHVGTEMQGGTECHHLAFTQDQFLWELWVPVAGDPTPRRSTFDFAPMLANLPQGAAAGNKKLEITQDYKNWRVGAAVDEKTFAFQPPEGAQKVDSFIEGQAGPDAEAPSPLLGEPAPDVTLKMLDGGEFRLKDHRDSHIVILDFWATWCGPCVQELPILTPVAQAYKDKGVVFCGVNLREKEQVIRDFLKEKKLEFTVALDSEGATGDAYHADAIPMLVLIDKKGVVQSVHVGYSPAIKTTLAKELDDLLAGKDLASAVRGRRKAEEAKAASETQGLQRTWSVQGAYTGAAVNPPGDVIYALQRGGRCAVLDRAGTTTRSFQLTGSDQAILRFARLVPGEDALLAFRTWGNSLIACKADGTKLWEEPGGDGIDDVWPADLDGDGRDEVIVGYNGGTGLHVFRPDGQRLWKRTDLGNVWHVTAGDLDGDGKLEVVTTSAQGNVHVFAAADGQPLRTLEPGLYANMVRTAKASAGQAALVLVAGSVEAGGEAMRALGADGKPLWTLELPKDVQNCDSMAVSPDGTKAALGLRGGRVCVVDIRQGRIVAQTVDQGVTPMVAWAPRGGTATPLLLVATGAALNAFEVSAADDAASRDETHPILHLRFLPPARVTAVESDGTIRLEPTGAQSPFFPTWLPVTEGHYLLASPPDQPRQLESLVRAAVTDIGAGNTLTAKVGAEAAAVLQRGDVVALVRPRNMTTTQIRALPAVIPLVKEDDARAPQRARDSLARARQTARLAQSVNHLKQIALALHNFHSTYGTFPPAVVFGPDGKPWHSWRVLLLPFVEQVALYNQYDFSQPWDSPKNRVLIEKVPSVYRDPLNGETAGSSTHYAALVGDQTIFPPTGSSITVSDGRASRELSRGLPLQNVLDGTSNTIGVVPLDPARNVPWTKPEDIAVGADFPGVGQPGGIFTPARFDGVGVAPVMFLDGSVLNLTTRTDPAMLRALTTIAGGEIVNRERLAAFNPTGPSGANPSGPQQILHLIRAGDKVLAVIE